VTGTFRLSGGYLDFPYDEDRCEPRNLTRIAFYGIVELLNV